MSAQPRTATSALSVESHKDRLDITLNRPERINALTPAMLFDLAEVLGAVDPATHFAVVLRGAGEHGFSSGFDLNVLRDLGPAAHDGDPLGTAVAALLACPVSTVAVLHGHCIGASVELVAACDLRLAHDDLRLAVPANKVGSLYRPAGIDLIARRFGWATASELFAFGRSLGATLALARGVVAFAGDADAVEREVDATTLRLADASVPAARHAAILREWAASGGLDEDARQRWDSIRADAVAARHIADEVAR